MDLPDGFSIRAATDADISGAADVLVADQLNDVGQVVLDESFLRNRWRRPGFDLARNTWVVVDIGGSVVAFGQAVREEPAVVESLGVVHPHFRGRGIGSALLDRIEARGAELLAGAPSGRFRHSVNASDGAAAALLAARGLHPIRHFWHMEIDLDGPLERPRAPAGSRSPGSPRRTTCPRSTLSSRRRSLTTGATTPSRTTGGWRKKRAAPVSTPTCGFGRPRLASCWAR